LAFLFQLWVCPLYFIPKKRVFSAAIQITTTGTREVAIQIMDIRAVDMEIMDIHRIIVASKNEASP
jgi:hypothetical protein